MRIAYSLSVLASVICLATSAFAADKSITVLEVSGKVLLTTADGVFPLEVGQTVSAGNKIFVGEEATARLTREDDACDVTLPSGKITVINPRKLCDVKITPTAGGASSLPPAAVGLGFFATVVITAGGVSLDDKDSVSP